MSLTEAIVAVNSVRKVWVVSQLLATLHEMAGLKSIFQLIKLKRPKMHVVYVCMCIYIYIYIYIIHTHNVLEK